MPLDVHRWTVAVAAAVAVAGPTSASAVESATGSSAAAHLRSTTPEIAAAVERARQASPTFRRLVEYIQQSDSYVYITKGDCGFGARACFVSVTESGSHPVLVVKVDTRQRDLDLMASIGHELRHTLEVISQPSIRDSAAKFHFYERTAFHAAGGTHVTHAAIDAGAAVRSEIRRANRQAR